jgi:hypothetical protein
MSDWAKRNATRLIALGSQREQTDARSEQEKSILKLKAPRLWQDLRDRLKANCEALNAETATSTLEFQLLPVSGAKIRRINRPAVLTVEFEQDSLRVRYSCGVGTGEYQVNVDTSGSVFFADAYHRRFTAEELGEKMLDSLLESPF